MAKDPFHQLHVYQTASEKGKQIFDCYRLMYKKALWIKAFHHLYPIKKLDRLSSQKIEETIIKLRNGEFRFFQQEGVNEQRNCIDRLALEVMRIILQTIYEPIFNKLRFSDISPHFALSYIKNNCEQMVWCINGKIDNVFEKNFQKRLLMMISEKISDRRFLLLLHNALSRGISYVAKVHTKFTAILIEIYLHKFDLFMEELKMDFENELSNNSQKLVSNFFEEMDYVRYKNSFFIGVNSSKKRAQFVFTEVKNFIEENLQLRWKEAQFSHFNKPVSFLEYNIRKGKYGIQLEIPKEKLRKIAQRNGYGKYDHFKPKPRLYLTNRNEFTIMTIYNRELKQIAIYYRLANNFHHLRKLFALAERSFLKTVAQKRKCSTKEVRHKMKNDEQGRLTVVKKLKTGNKMYNTFVQFNDLKGSSLKHQLASRIR